MKKEYKNVSAVLIVSMMLVLSTFLPTVFAAVTFGENSVTSDDVLTLEGATSISAIGDVDVTGTVMQNGYALMPVGSLTMYAGATAPDGYLLADGSAVSRTTYSDLFAVIGTTYGVGDGATTFNLPDLTGSMAIGKDSGSFDSLGATGGSETVTLTEDELPAHTHGVTDPGHTHTTSGTLQTTGSNTADSADDSPGEPDIWNTVSTESTSSTTGISIDSTGGGEAFSIMNPYVVVNYIIKY